ncbi:hypothetical protein C8R46DRAFT_921821 [Mycena filopes]|nr:hypothetical protein C8R46DRAFT_921821 [Mycena filopes]
MPADGAAPLATSSSSSARIACPPDAPPWFINAQKGVTEVDLGCHYDALVAVWTRIEHASRFEQGPTNLSAKGRPKVVGRWVADGRQKKARTDLSVTDAAAYAVEWQAWWDALQPKWRKKGSDGKWSLDGYGDGAEWGPLYQWGVNGILNLVVSLYFWGCSIVGNDAQIREWELAVLDVSWMMEGMVVYYEKFRRRF